MAVAYSINKSTNKRVEVKGLKAQYLGMAVGIVFASFVLYFIFRAIINDLFGILIAVGVAVIAITYIIRISRKYGANGLALLSASRQIPRFVLRRKSFSTLLKDRMKRHPVKIVYSIEQ